VNLTYIRFYRGLRYQNIDRSKFIYKSPFQPYLSYWGLFWTIIFILINGFYIFWKFNVSDFLTCYINIPFFAILYFGHKVWKKTKVWGVDKMDFVTGIPTVEETETPVVVPTTVWGKILEMLF